MVTITLHCPYCQSEALVRNGHAPNGKQLYRCRSCGRQSANYPKGLPFPTKRFATSTTEGSKLCFRQKFVLGLKRRF